MQKYKTFLIAFYCQLMPAILLAWSLGAKDLGMSYADNTIGTAEILSDGIIGGLIPSIVFGALMAACVGRKFSRPLLSLLMITFLFIIFSLDSINGVATVFKDSYGATWYDGEAFFELGLGSSITIPAYSLGLILALVSLRLISRKKAVH